MPYGGTVMARIARERDEARAEAERLMDAHRATTQELDAAMASWREDNARKQAEAKRLRKTLVAARDKFTELELPVYADACNAALDAR